MLEKSSGDIVSVRSIGGQSNLREANLAALEAWMPDGDRNVVATVPFLVVTSVPLLGAPAAIVLAFLFLVAAAAFVLSRARRTNSPASM